MRKKSKNNKNTWIVPNACPGIAECTHVLIWDLFETICQSGSWIYCEHAGAFSRKYKKLPYEWLLAHKLGGFPKNEVKII